MNKPFRPAPPVAPPSYEEDGHGWAMMQGEAIRARRLDDIDWDNVAEEIEALGRSEQRAAESALRVVRWHRQPARRGNSGRSSIRIHLRDFDRQMRRNPSLNPRLADILSNAYEDARDDASTGTDLPVETFPVDPPSCDEIRASLEL